MAKDPPVPGKKPTDDGVTPGWEKKVYSPERIEQFARGELSLKDLHALSGSDMHEMAMMGFSLYEQGRYDKAKVIFQGLCALDPNEGYYRTALGAVFLAEDDLEMAERALSLAIKLNPKEIGSYVNRGEVFLRQGRIADAAQDFTKALELDPQKKDPLSHRAQLLAAATVETIRAAERESSGGRTEKPTLQPRAVNPVPPKPQALQTPAVPKKK